MTEQNGNAPHFFGVGATPADMIARLLPQVAPLVECTVRGIIAARGPIEPPMLISVIATVTAAALARTITVQDFGTELRFKKLLRESFEDGLKAVSMFKPPTMTAEEMAALDPTQKGH